MATTLKILGQSAPSAATYTNAYTVPALTSTVISSITVCNRSSTPTSFRIMVGTTAASQPVNAEALYYDLAIPGNDTFVFTGGLTLETGKIVVVYNTLATLSFSIYGQENS
jgi:hypothetical protein